MINVKTLGSGIKSRMSIEITAFMIEKKVNFLASNPSESLPHLIQYLQTSNDENGVLEALLSIDKIADSLNQKT